MSLDSLTKITFPLDFIYMMFLAMFQKVRPTCISRNFITQFFILVCFQFLGMKEVTPKKGRHWRRLLASFFRQNDPCATSKYTEYREIVKRFSLKPGNYIIVPFTKHSNKEGEFLLRVFSEKPSGLIQGSW